MKACKKFTKTKNLRLIFLVGKQAFNTKDKEVIKSKLKRYYRIDIPSFSKASYEDLKLAKEALEKLI